ncbi:glutathione S-transferase family protein [Granulosicoccus sp. 3-233]|uniref:glutathione S-transferase family protein n=1 Tax=Granulosicoccus sp. 3-233 TaxID=3417969 RepID=UPI003D3432A1
MASESLKLVIGNKNYSSWSLRPWILMQHAQLQFEEIAVPLGTPQGEALLQKWCPAKRVPVLHEGPLVLWDSLAICEYIADKVTDHALWPERASDRARARAMSAEMHAGFTDLRAAMPMNCRRLIEGFKPSLAVQIDINRIVQLFEDALQQSGGPWLFTHYTVADAMFAPVVSRFHSYGITLPRLSRDYVERVLADPPMRDWYSAAAAEAHVIEKFEIRT